MPSFGLCGPGYRSISRNITSDRLVNLFTELIQSGTGASPQARFALIQRPGRTLLGTLGDTPVRAVAPTTKPIDLSNPTAHNCGWWVVSGGTVYMVAADGSSRSIGTVARHDFPGLPAFPAQIFVTGDNSAFIRSNGKIYSATLDAPADAVTEVTGLPVDFVTSLTFMDGRAIISGVVNGARSAQFWISNLADFVTFDPLNFGTKEGNVDAIMGCLAAFGYLGIWGSQTTEIWGDSGDALFPFSRVAAGAIIETGLALAESPIDTVQRIDNTVMFLSQNRSGGPQVTQIRGLTPVRVSNFALEAAMLNYNTAAAIATVRELGGHSFYCLTFALDGVTWVMDTSSGHWFEWNHWTGAAFEADIGRYYGFNFPIGLAGDYRNGNLYVESLTVAKDNGDPVRRIRIAPHIDAEKKIVYYSQLVLDQEQGNVTLGVLPEWDLQISNDGGWTFGPVVTAAAGLTGQYAFRTIWRRLSRARDRVYCLETSSDVPTRIVDAYLESEAGDGS